MDSGRRTSRTIRFSRFRDEAARSGNRISSEVNRSRTPIGRKPLIEEDAVSSEDFDLKVKCVNLNIDTNTKDHRTDEYSISKERKDLIVRRGQPFDVSLEFNRKFDLKADYLKISFLIGSNPSPPKGTLVKTTVLEKEDKKGWNTWLLKNEDKKLSVRVLSPADCIVGIWSLVIETKIMKDQNKVILEYENKQRIYVLFNAWCKEDTVFHPDPTLLEEYVLNDHGKIYRGSKYQISPKHWNFGQFEDTILDCAMYLLDKHFSSWSRRNDPISVSRKLSALANCQDDDGILVGNWSGDYEDGISPSHWSGSVAILQKYFATKTPVCYGQCWVFSGLVTTLCRTLGIPARSVTNFASAHDCDGSVSIDTYFDMDDSPLEELNHDSVWNFHVWNDAWMTRPDLPSGYGGWQAIDGTPQEASDGYYQCGPAPLHAIKQGEINHQYDAPFVFAEVNADRIYWRVDDNGEIEKLKVKKLSVGHHISTKIPVGKQLGEWEFCCADRERQDITIEYKHKEGTDEERAAVIKANQYSSKAGIYAEEGKKNDVTFNLKGLDKLEYGNELVVTLKVTNNSIEKRTVTGCLCITSMYYTGIPAHRVNKLKIQQTIQPKDENNIQLKVTFDDYYEKLVEECHLQASCMCRVLETQQVHVDQDPFRLIKPDLLIKAPEKGKVDEKLKVNISFTNPLKIALTGCSLTVEGPGLQEPRSIREGIVKSNQTFTTTVEIVPVKPGKRKLIASFNSRQLNQVEGSCEITITA